MTSTGQGSAGPRVTCPRVPVFRMLGCTGPRSSACVSPPSDCLHAVLQCSMLLYAALKCSMLVYAALQAGPQWCSSRVILMPDTVGLGRVYHSLFTPYTTDFILVTKLRYHDIFESIYSWVFETAAWQWYSTFTIRQKLSPPSRYDANNTGHNAEHNNMMTFEFRFDQQINNKTRSVLWTEYHYYCAKWAIKLWL